MALIITATPESKLTLANTTIEFATIYERLQVIDFEDGKSMKVVPYNFQSKEVYDSGSGTLTIPEISGNQIIPVDTEAGEEQTITLAHQRRSEFLVSLGYLVEILYP